MLYRGKQGGALVEHGKTQNTPDHQQTPPPQRQPAQNVPGSTPERATTRLETPGQSDQNCPQRARSSNRTEQQNPNPQTQVRPLPSAPNTKHKGATTLPDTTHAEGPAWWKTRENHTTFLTDQDTLEDTTYQTPLNTQPHQQTPKER